MCAPARIEVCRDGALVRGFRLPSGKPVLTWSCHVCGDTRPDSRISVDSRTVYLGVVEAQENVRHCNDRPGCIAGAPLIHWLKEDPS